MRKTTYILLLSIGLIFLLFDVSYTIGADKSTFSFTIGVSLSFESMSARVLFLQGDLLGYLSLFFLHVVGRKLFPRNLNTVIVVCIGLLVFVRLLNVVFYFANLPWVGMYDISIILVIAELIFARGNLKELSLKGKQVEQ